MNVKKKILLLLTVCVMCFMGVSAYAADKVTVKQTGVITSDNQTFKVKAPTKENEQYYYAYTPKENGIYKFSLTVDDNTYNLSPAIVTEAGEVKRYSNTENGVATVEYTLRAGVKIYLGLIINPTSAKEKEVNVKLSISRIDSNVQIKILDDKYNVTEVSKDNIKGLSWDKKTSTLTLNNYTGNISKDLVIYHDDEKYKEGETVYVNVKGTNTIKFTSGGINVDSMNVTTEFIGNGELNIVRDKVQGGDSVILGQDVIVDGPSINIEGAFYDRCIDVRNYIMRSGTIYVDLYPAEKESGNSIYLGIEARYSIIIEDGSVIVKFENPYDNTSIWGSAVLQAINKVDILNGTVIFTGSDKIIEKFGKITCSNADKLNISKNAKVCTGSVIDISKFKLEVIDKKLEYDKKEKKARINVEGLKIGRDIKVEYKNNIKVGKANIIVTGIGNFKGTLKGSFKITPAVANGAVVGTVINDGQYKYKVTKAGSKNGVLIGKVSVVGLKKKSIKKIVIAKTVVLDGVTYKITSIGKNAFKKKKITSAKIGKNVVKIGTGAFAKCKKLRKLTIKSTKIKKIGKKAFAKTSKKLVIKVPKKVKKKYAKKLKKVGFKGIVK